VFTDDLKFQLGYARPGRPVPIRLCTRLTATFQVDLQNVEPPYPDVRGCAKVEEI